MVPEPFLAEKLAVFMQDVRPLIELWTRLVYCFICYPRVRAGIAENKWLCHVPD
jgi:hypothetical protein